VFVTRDFEKGEFVLEYHGRLVPPEDADSLDQTYVYHFEIGSNKYWYVYSN